MNNSQLTYDSLEEKPVDTEPMLNARHAEILKIIEALDAINQSEYWKFLEQKVFQTSLNSSVNQLCIEKDDRRMVYLQGKIEVLSKYADFKGFSEAYRLELKNINQQRSPKQ